MRRAFFLLFTLALLLVLPTPVRADGPTHTVAYGETLYAIARKYGISPQALASANGIPTNSWVYAGQRLKIPGAANTNKSASAPAPNAAQLSPSGVYLVRAGDTLYSVARKFGVTVQALADANNIPPNGVLYVGWQLRIPGRAASGSSTSSQPPSKQSDQPTNRPTDRSTTYIVQPGDTLYRIALNHNVTTQAIVIANNLPTQFVYSGQRLIIPGSAATTSAPANDSANPAPASNSSAPANSALNLRVSGIPAYRQKQTLTCEESAASMSLRGALTEAQIVAAMPRSENPFEGIRGDTNHPLLGGLTNYGTYAQGLQKGLAALGQPSTVLYGTPYSKFKQAILDHLRAGRPVIWWTTWRESYQTPQWVKLSSGITLHLVPYEHTVVIVGANDSGITYNDPYDGTVRYTTWANHQRTSGYFGNMALVIKPK